MSQSEKVKRWRKATKKRIVKAMGSKCVCCGYNKCNRALKLHHLDPEKKEFGFGRIMANPKSWAKIVIELRKCILVCGNCHEEINEGITPVPKKCSRFDETFVTYKKIMPQTYCPVCKGPKAYVNKTCSSACAATLARKVDWNNVDLPAMMKKYKYWAEIGRQIGVTGGAVKKRAKKLGLV